MTKAITPRESNLAEIRSLAERFFSWPNPDDQTTVTLNSAILFAEFVAGKLK